MRAVGNFLGVWLTWSIAWTILSLLFSGFVLVHVTIGLGLLTAVAWLLIERIPERKPKLPRAPECPPRSRENDESSAVRHRLDGNDD